MATHKEKNLLSEITYLTRLIGQHKNGHTFLTRKWEPATSVPQKMPYYPRHKFLSHPYFSASKTKELLPYKYINPDGKKNSVSQAPRLQEKKNSSVYINPKFKSGSLPKQLSSNETTSTCLLATKQSNVHINPHFSPNKSTKIVKVHMNRNFSSGHDKSETNMKTNQIVNAASSTSDKLKVHINPKFCKLLPDKSPHTQLRTLMTNKVHVNPKLVEEVLKEKNESENNHVKNSISSPNKIVGIPVAESSKVGIITENGYAINNVYAKPSVHKGKDGINLVQNSWRKSEFLTLGKCKLVRVNQKHKLGNDAKHKDRNKTPRSSFNLTRNRSQTLRSPSGVVKKAKVMTSKYKLIKNQSAIQSTTKQCTNKYKIDRRPPTTKRSQQSYIKSGESYRQSIVLRSKKSCLMKNTQRQERLALNSVRSLSGNMVWRRTWSLQAKEFKTTNTKLYRIGSTPLKKKNETSRSNNTFNKSLVRIGGVLYKTSRNKLTRSQGGPSNVEKLNSGISLKKKGKAVTKGQVLFIRGQKFVMDTKGKTLRRLSSSNSSNNNKQNASSAYSFRRVDIGGVTFVKKSSNLLMRTNTHKARSLLSHAKQKSIATLMKKLKKNNQPCIFYQKFGRCFRMEKGTCPCVHDRKHVAVCKRFLQGKCFADKCLLSHDVVPEKMPTCKYFLEACCNRQNCPYLHVKVNSKADICTSFLQGYCANGKQCKKRHVCICPEFEKTGKCVKGKHCPYPHKTVRQKKNVSRKRSVIIQASNLPLDHKKCSLEVGKALVQPCAKNELMRYYLAPQDIVGNPSKENSSHDEVISARELNGTCNIPCGPEVSSSCGSVPVVTSGDRKLSSSKRILNRDKIGSLPSFIPL